MLQPDWESKLKIKNQVEHAAAIGILKKEGIDYFTYNPKPGSTIKFVLRGLPLNVSCEEIAQQIKKAGIVLTQTKQMTKHSVHPETWEKFIAPLPLWVLTITREAENIQKLKQLTGILHFKIRIEDLNTKKYHVFAPMGRFQLESIYLYFPPSSQLVYNSWDDGGK